MQHTTPARVLLGTLALLTSISLGAQLAAGQEKFFGSILDGRAGKPAPIPTGFLELFDKVNLENSGKWANVEAERDVMTWEVLDEHYAFTREHDVPLTFHTLLWSEKEPAWAADLEPAELLGEIEEWFAAVAARYPALEYIDVVNEAPHGKTGSPAVVAALGGTGATGYDHVVEAYRLARRYFPAARLVLNDYDVLKRETYTAFDACAAALVEQGLLDVLGCQGHFLEKSSAARVQARLDHLSVTTGLPIMISEFELAFADDADQLAQYETIFPVIWEHPAVIGFGLWGYLEGNMWKDAGYLIRADGTDRPAMTWLRDYLGGGAPVVGEEGDLSLRLEAELWDRQEGVQTWSGTIGYCDAGDYLRFDDVDIAGANRLSARFASGGNGRGRAELRRGAPDGPLLGTLPLPNTGGYDQFTVESTELEEPLGQPVDLFVVFAGANGVGNFDYFELSGPRPPAAESRVTILAAGNTGAERMRLQVDGVTVATWTEIGGSPDARDFRAFSYVHPEAGLSASRVRVRFDNDDGRERDLRVDAIEIDGVRYESEAPSTYSRGTWKSADGCAGGNKQSEWLHCNGYFAYESSSSLRVPEPAAALSVSLTPNPASGSTLISWGRALSGAVTVADAFGRVVYTERDLRGGVALDVSALAAGQYVVHVVSGGAAGSRLLMVR